MSVYEKEMNIAQAREVYDDRNQWYSQSIRCLCLYRREKGINVCMN